MEQEQRLAREAFARLRAMLAKRKARGEHLAAYIGDYNAAAWRVDDAMNRARRSPVTALGERSIYKLIH